MENAILNIGDMVSKYRVVRLMNICDASFIYEAEDVQLRRAVCLELFSPQFVNDELKHRILVEAHTAARLSHPNICPVYDVQDVDGRLLVVRELFGKGRTLPYEMGGKPLGIDLVLSYAIQISSALTAAHGVGMVFRDLKLSDILVTPSGVKLLGIGLFVPLSAPVPSGEDDPRPALLRGGSSPLDGTQVWFCTYLSPEQVSGMPVDARSDLFSFGAVLYEMATGRPAFASDTARVKPIELLQKTPPAPRSLDPNLPPELEEIILKAIEKDRDLRYQKASEMSVDLLQLQTKQREVRKLDRLPKSAAVGPVPLPVLVRPRRLWAWACGIAAIGLIAFAFFFTQHQSKRATQTSVMGRGSSLEPVQDSSQIASSGKNYALLFATDDYDYWPHLNNPLHDAHTIADELRDNYSFADPEPRVVSNPRTKEIIDILHEYAGRSYGRNDQLFIFFAGHGFFDEREQEGFLIARESKSQKDDSEHSSYLNFSRLSMILDNIPVAHIFVVIDACYGGAFDTKVTKWAGRRGAADEYADVAPEKFIRRKLAVKGRLYLTSGQITTVPDGKPGQHSPFAHRFIEVLRGYGGRKQLVTATSIAVDVARLEPEPRFGDFGDSAPGADFLFIPK